MTGHEIIQYISLRAGIDLSLVFRQYLTTTQVPVLEYGIQGTELSYRWTDVVPGFDMPVRVTLGAGHSVVLRPQTTWQVLPLPRGSGADLEVDESFYVTARRVM